LLPVFSGKDYPISMGFSDDETDQMMKMVFGDDATYNDTGATATGATDAASSAGNQSDGAWNNIAGTDIYSNAPSFDFGVNYLTQSPPANPALTLGNQMPGANQPDGSWYQPFPSPIIDAQGRITQGILATAPSAESAFPISATTPTNGVLWGQFGKGTLKAAGGGLAAAAGASLCSTTGLGCIVGAPMAAIGTSDAIQGGTMALDALHGQPLEGVNPLKNFAETVSPQWGGLGYDALSLGATAGSLYGDVPLIVDPALTGINTTRSLFGVTVPRMDNAVGILGHVFDSNVQRGILGASAGTRAYDAYKDYPGR
jgi:hypothetical protein